ncbi:MAG: OB-fold protein [Chitinophagaceae bacterium]
MKRKKMMVYIMLALLLVLVVVVVYIYKEYNRTHEDTASIKPDYSLTAGNLIKEFETEEPASNKKYWNKVILVDGMVKEVSKDDRGLYSVILGDTASMSSVRCSMDSIHNHETAAVKKGDHLAVKGICAGFNADEMLGSDVILVRCAVYSKK